MAIPGYDPIDIDHMLEARLSKEEIAERLDEDDLESYRADDASLVSLLDGDEIREVLDMSG